MKILSKAKFLGLDEQRRQRGGTPAIIEVDGIRFFSLNARSEEEAGQMNTAARMVMKADDEPDASCTHPHPQMGCPDCGAWLPAQHKT
jgi:hypothetical protein